MHSDPLALMAEVDLAIGGAPDARTVSGSAHALAGWLTGRTRGEELTASPAGPLPHLPEWI